MIASNLIEFLQITQAEGAGLLRMDVRHAADGASCAVSLWSNDLTGELTVFVQRKRSIGKGTSSSAREARARYAELVRVTAPCGEHCETCGLHRG